MAPGKIFLIPTPISGLNPGAIINPQSKEIISSLSWFLCENIRTSRRFISSLQLGINIEALEFSELNKDTPDAALSLYMKRIAAGESAGVMSEAGCPGIADPGAKIAALAHQRGLEIVPLVGPSSIFMALMSSGFSGQSFTFHGYLPIESKAAKDKIAQMEKEVRASGTTQVFMETPYRNNQLLELLLATCHPSSLLSISCNITASDELIKTQTVRNWSKSKPDLHKKPTIFLLGR